MFYISPYKLNMYLECPRHYWWHYINPATKNRYPERPYFTMGEHVHNTLKYFFMKLPVEKRTEKALLYLLDHYWQKKQGKEGGFRDDGQEEEYRERAETMLRNFCQTNDLTVTPLWASDRLISVPVSDQLTFMGKIDRVDELPDGLHIIDYKTSKEEREDEWQLPMYAVMARYRFQKPVRELSYYFLELGTKVAVPANEAREAATIAKVEQIVKAMPFGNRQELWQCPQGEQCNHCDYLYELGFDPKTK